MFAVAAVVAAILVSELTLRWRMPDPATDVHTPAGISIPDERLGWRLLPHHTTIVTVANRAVAYAVDRDGHRAPSEETRIDPAAPSIIFCGESIMLGWGLAYEESIPARVAERTGLQAIDQAVFGYGNHQALRRLEDELPRFGHVRAVVSLFHPLQLERNTRPWEPGFSLDGAGGLVERPASRGFWSHVRLRVLWNQAPLVHTSDRIALAAALLARTDARARAAGAKSLFVVPSYGPLRLPREHAEAELADALFERQGLRAVIVDVDPSLRLGDPWHPNAQGAQSIADVIVAALAR